MCSIKIIIGQMGSIASILSTKVNSVTVVANVWRAICEGTISLYSNPHVGQHISALIFLLRFQIGKQAKLLFIILHY